MGQDCFPLWFEVEEGGQKSVVMGAVFYFPIGEHSEEETAPRREVRVIMLPNPRPRDAARCDVRCVGARRGAPMHNVYG